MPLVDNINVLDLTNAMTARSKNLRRYRVGNDQDFIDYIETVESTTYEFPRATEQAAKNAIDLIKNQTTADNQTVNASMVEDVRNVGSYKVISTSTFTTTTEAAVAPAPEVGGITWSRNSETVSSWPQSVTMTSANSADRIWYRIDAINSSGATVPGEFTDGGSNNVTVSLNASTFAGGYNGWHKRVIIVAEVRRTQLTGEVYVGAQSSRTFTQNKPSVGSLTFNPAGLTSYSPPPYHVTFPINLTISSSNSNDFIQAKLRKDEGFGWTSYPNYSNYVNIGQGSGTINNINTNRRFGSYQIKLVEVQAYASVNLDGYVYTGSVITRYYVDRL